VERGSIGMVDPGRQLASQRHCSGACGGMLPRWFKV